MSTINPPRGTHDLIGDDSLKYLYVNEVFHKAAQLYNYEYIETPIFESLSVFDRTLGETSDIVSKEMYVFEDRGGDKLCLRPEGTAGVARAFLSNSLQRSLPLKLYYSGSMFRYERPQKGRYRQFHQLGIETLGIDHVLADIECLQMASHFLAQLDLQGDTELHINSLGSADCRWAYREKLVSYFENYKSELSEDSQRRLSTNPLRILDSKNESDKKIISTAPQLEASLSTESLSRFEALQSGLEKLKIPFKKNSNLVRGLDYYNHLVFEYKTNALGAQDALLSGGRYDGLIQTMGGPQTPGIGFAAGVERLMMLLKQTPKKLAPVAIAPMSDDANSMATQVAEVIRVQGVPTDFIITGNLSNRLKKATRMQARGIIIIGEDEIANNVYTYKDFATSQQKRFTTDDLRKLFSSER